MISVKMSVIEITHLLIESITKKPYTEFIKDFQHIGMKEDSIGHSIYEKSHHLKYITDDNILVSVDISGSENNVIDLSIMIINQVTFMSSLFSSSMKYFNKLVELFSENYGEGFPENYGLNTLIFENDDIEIFLSYKKKSKMEITTMRVKNKKYSLDNLSFSSS